VFVFNGRFWTPARREDVPDVVVPVVTVVANGRKYICRNATLEEAPGWVRGMRRRPLAGVRSAEPMEAAPTRQVVRRSNKGLAGCARAPGPFGLYFPTNALPSTARAAMEAAVARRIARTPRRPPGLGRGPPRAETRLSL